MVAPTTTEAPSSKDMVRLLGLAAVVGIVAAIGATVFLWVVHELQTLAFSSLPDAMGYSSAPWWWAAILLLIGATLVAIAQRLPGHTGNGPLTGFHFNNPLQIVPGILLASIASLVFGMALGPEAPLIVLGSALGLILLSRSNNAQAKQAGPFLGGAAAIGAVFGNPFITVFMILEFAAIGLAPGTLVLPVLVALGSSYLVQVGIWGIPGVGTHSLGVPGLPAYNDIAVGDLAGAAAVAILAGIVTLIAREGGLRFGRVAERSPVPALYIGALVTAAALTVAMLGFDVQIGQILFSGQYAMAELITETSVITVLAILIFKTIAYTVALGGGFRGGPIFPAMFLGIVVAVGGALLLPDISVSALAAAGIAAATAAMIKLPATSALLGALLIGDSVPSAIAPFAILGAVIGLGIRLAADRRDARSTVSPIESASH
jgi:H+/Cl- antiporter ClcA